MRLIVFAVFIFVFTAPVFSQRETWSWGGEVGLQMARLSITSATGASSTSSIHTSPSFGLYLRSPETKPNLFEIQAGYEITGANKEVYYARATNEFVRINDRFATVPVTAMWFRHFFNSEKWWAGLGIKGQLVVDSYVRHANPLPPGTTGIIFTPETEKFFGSVSGEMMYAFRLTEICLSAAYSLTPVINDQGVRVIPVCLNFSVKHRITAGGRYGEF